ncbi:hypothetical protein NQ023_03035 [Corynebacterium phoceense]|uniref:DUF6339 family protein n=2 Tax=Bacillati TaxID=1783272 RepID=UPI00211CBE29|nr:DUF6339 family protein [Corynebacterium phoceense]MCQ9331053.1 hypothetical protein [Corynebacterium phoceense]MCQ9347449.1 hypothetical protein [Corynebacterium phoceense]
MITYYPRLSDSYSMLLIADFSDKSPDELAKEVQIHNEMAFYNPLATYPVPTQEIEELRSSLLRVAEDCGFPEAMARSQVRDFDQRAAAVLYDSLDLVPAEAANQEIWNYLTLSVLPDIAAWRYPNISRSPSFERWLGVDRNVFRKLWWREATLGRSLNALLGEDEAVGIMERPSLSGNPAVARAIIQSFDRVYPEFAEFGRSDLLRAVMVNIRRHLPLVDFEFYEDDELQEFISEIIYAACKNYADVQRESSSI